MTLSERGYTAIYTHETWDELLASVLTTRTLTTGQQARLRDGWDEAQRDYAEYCADMADIDAARDRDAEMDEQAADVDAAELAECPW